ncbi:helix-turn-helix transcriptional regulator [Bradyrhizobium canariense]|uniref:helix-turn-helix transcriptional regulator n=1 Tax=Bradyrhizobium canariense TaxID=255045 RepID=UPI000B8FE5C8|nr:hypothetical protein [Bradyrhizobium canariense]
MSSGKYAYDAIPQRALALGRLFDRNGAERRILTQVLDNVKVGVFLPGPNARLDFANAPGRAMLEEGALLVERMGLLTATTPELQRALRDALAVAEDGNEAGPLSLLASPPLRYSVRALAVMAGEGQARNALRSAKVAVFVRKISPADPLALEALASLYEFTPGEVRVIDAVMKVDGVKALAQFLGLTHATVKTHLHNVFRKTHTSGQRELVKLIAGFAEPQQE